MNLQRLGGRAGLTPVPFFIRRSLNREPFSRLVPRLVGDAAFVAEVRIARRIPGA